MPIYAYRCSECKEEVWLLRPVDDKEEPSRCSGCSKKTLLLDTSIS